MMFEISILFVVRKMEDLLTLLKFIVKFGDFCFFVFCKFATLKKIVVDIFIHTILDFDFEY